MMKRVIPTLLILGALLLPRVLPSLTPSLRALLENFLAPATQVTLHGPYPLVRVVDGDTLRILVAGQDESVRLIGIDTPEKHPGSKLDRDARSIGLRREELQALGESASRYTETLVNSKGLWLEFDAEERDHYRRLLAYVYIEDAKGSWTFGGRHYRQVNAEVIAGGWGDLLTIPPNVRYSELYRDLQNEARRHTRGMWASLP